MTAALENTPIPAAARPATKTRRFALYQAKVDLALDTFLGLSFVVVMEERFTGLQWHELIGVFIGVAMLVHIIFHWRWVLNITRTFFRKLLHESRLNYVLNWLLFVDLLAASITGLAISRTLGLSLGIAQSTSRSLQQLHIITSELSLILVALHVALHWRWIVDHVQKYTVNAFRAIFRRSRRKPAQPAQPLMRIDNPTVDSAGGIQ